MLYNQVSFFLTGLGTVGCHSITAGYRGGGGVVVVEMILE